jgi:hypothetical protein
MKLSLDELEQIINCSVVTVLRVARGKEFVTLNGSRMILMGLIET